MIREVSREVLKEYWSAEKIAGDSMDGVNLGRKFSTSVPRWSGEMEVNGGKGLIGPG